MRTAGSPAEMAALADEARRDGKTVAFVPTMGALHDGHSSLLAEARRRGDVSVLSIFVNPTQFGPKEDLSRYPRTLELDTARAEAAGVDIVYAPTADAMYPPGFQTRVTVTELELPMCGAGRPGHFVGVATVVLKLFSAVRPHIALFGQKDYQQLQVIRRMVRDLDLGVDVVGMPIVRDADGLALSSRNAYLSPTERAHALSLSRALEAGAAQYRSGARDAATVLAAANEIISAARDGVQLEYLDLRDADSLEPLSTISAPAVLAIAALVGKTRLIDNLVLTTSV